MNSRLLVATLAATLACALSPSATTQVYTWKDASGRTYFSDQPPPSGKVRTLRGGVTTDLPAPSASAPAASASNIPAAGASTPVSGPKSWQERDKEFQQRQASKAEAEAKAKKEEDFRKQKAAYCADLQRQAALLERGGRIGRANDLGETIALSDAEISAELAATRQRLSSECK